MSTTAPERLAVRVAQEAVNVTIERDSLFTADKMKSAISAELSKVDAADSVQLVEGTINQR